MLRSITFLCIPKDQHAAVRNLSIASREKAFEALADISKERLIFSESASVDIRVDDGRIYIGPNAFNNFNAARVSAGVEIQNIEFLREIKGIVIVLGTVNVSAALAPRDAPAHK